MTVSQEQASLAAVDISRSWPVLSPEHLAWLELRRDPWHDKIPPERIPLYVREAIRFGEEAARKHAGDWPLKDLINRIIKSGVRIRFSDRHPEDPSVRAQYAKKPPTIDVYRSSVDELLTFFSGLAGGIRDEELIRLHLYHEWFHHLEETKCGRTDLTLPKVAVGKRGPFTVRKTLSRTREIAAHAFTRKAMGLSWSPLLVDRLISLTRKGWSKSRIREHFHELKAAADTSLFPPAAETSGEEKDEKQP